jgi:hypothetical protein
VAIVLLVVVLAGGAFVAFLLVSARTKQVTSGNLVRVGSGMTRSGSSGPPVAVLRPLPDINGVPVSASAAQHTAEEKAPAAPPPPAPAAEPAPQPPTPAEIRWCVAFDPRSTGLDDRSRLRLIGDLGVVAKEWCVPLLCQAYAEEPEPSHRQAALIALAACHSREAGPTFQLALASSDQAERAIAADALTDLEPPPPTRKRRTVERY